MIWKTRDGRLIEISQMSDGHLLNTIAMLRRTHRRRAFALSMAADRYALDAPDGAAMAAEQEAVAILDLADETDDESVGRLCRPFMEMIRESRRRGLEIPE